VIRGSFSQSFHPERILDISVFSSSITPKELISFLEQTLFNSSYECDFKFLMSVIPNLTFEICSQSLLLPLGKISTSPNQFL